MKIAIVLFGLLAWIGCNDEVVSLNEEVLATDAKWTNMLAVDGCSWHFAVNTKDTSFSMVPDDASISKIEDAVGEMEGAYSFTDVYLKYSLTGRKKEIQCGWGHTATYDEISVKEIKKR